MNERMDVSLSELAEACNISVTHFVREFRRSVGMPPHQWMLSRRIHKAKALLARSSDTLADIHQSSGTMISGIPSYEPSVSTTTGT